MGLLTQHGGLQRGMLGLWQGPRVHKQLHSWEPRREELGNRSFDLSLTAVLPAMLPSILLLQPLA